MFSVRSIAARLILAISPLAAITCTVLGTFSLVHQRSLRQWALDRQPKSQYDSADRDRCRISRDGEIWYKLPA